MNSWNSILQKLHHLAASTQEHLAKAGEKLRRQAAAVIFGITAAAALFCSGMHSGRRSWILYGVCGNAGGGTEGSFAGEKE